MTADIAVRGTAPAVALPSTETTRSLVEWAAELQAAHTIAKALCTTSFVPATWRGKPDQGAAAILTGSGMGLSPTTSLQIFFEINGRIGIEADAKVALTRSAGHDVWTEERTADRCTVVGRRKGWPADRVERITLTMDDAKRDGWTKNETYAKTPADMLYHHTSARVCSAIAPEVLYGIPVVDELVDLPPIVTTATVERPTVASLTAGRRPITETPQDAEPVEIGDAPEAASTEQVAEMMRLLREVGQATAPKARKRIEQAIGRVVDAPKDLTSEEAQVVIASLFAEAAMNEEAGQPALDTEVA